MLLPFLAPAPTPTAEWPKGKPSAVAAQAKVGEIDWMKAFREAAQTNVASGVYNPTTSTVHYTASVNAPATYSNAAQLLGSAGR